MRNELAPLRIQNVLPV